MLDSKTQNKKGDKRDWQKILLTAIGIISLILGVVGIVVPLLPTTPFLLLSAGIFMRSSDTMYQWLMNHRWLGKYIRNFQEHKAIPLGTKIGAVGLLWLTIGYSIIYLVESTILRILLCVIAVGVSAHILHYKTLKK